MLRPAARGMPPAERGIDPLRIGVARRPAGGVPRNRRQAGEKPRGNRNRKRVKPQVIAMMQVPVHNQAGEQVDQIEIDEQWLGGEVRPDLLKQAYVRYHANRRQGTAKAKTRGERNGSRQKLYRQKGTGNARRGDKKANILVGGGRAHGPKPHSWRKGMPRKMRRLANRNALLAKLVDGEIKLVDGLNFDTPSTKQFAKLLQNVGVDHRCLLALDDTRSSTGLSARNLEDVTLTQIDRLNAFDLLNHRYLLADKASFEAYLGRVREWAQANRTPAQEAA